MRPKKKQTITRYNLIPIDFDTAFGTGQVLAGAGKAYKKYVGKHNPAKLERCVKAVQKKGGAKNAYAVCKASMSRGNKGTIQRYLIRLNPSSKKNPEGTAVERYEYFHGRQPETDDTFEERFHRHEVLSGIGKLVSLRIRALNGAVVELKGFKGALLAQDEKGKQLYIVGGDQAVNLREFGITKQHELEILGQMTDVVYLTTKDHLRPEDGGTANYHHKFQKGDYPFIGYDVRNKLLSIQGGGYELPAEGIDG